MGSPSSPCTLSELPVYTKCTGIPGVRGVGAFAARGLLEDEANGEYAGEIVREAELAGARRSSRYVFDLGNGLAVDARAVCDRGGGYRDANSGRRPGGPPWPRDYIGFLPTSG